MGVYEKRLLKELPLYEEQGLIDATSSQKLKAYLQSNLDLTKSSFKKLFFEIFGIVFLVASIYLYISYNWKYISDNWRLAISMLPLLISFVLLFFGIKNGNKAFIIAGQFANIAGLFSAFILPSLIFNIVGNFEDLIVAVLSLFILLPICLKSKTGLLINAILIVVFARSIMPKYYSHNLEPFYYIVFIATFLINSSFAFLSKRTSHYDNTIFLLIWLTTLLSVFLCSNRISFITSFIFASLALSMLFKDEFLETLSYSAAIIFICSICNIGKIYNSELVPEIVALQWIIFILGVIFLSVLISKKIKVYDALSLIIFAMLFLCIALEQSALDIKILANIGVFMLFACFIARAFKAGNIQSYWSSFAILSLYSIVKFFDTNWTMLERSCLFLAVGIVLIAMHIIFNRKRRA